jgi:hypothetical protein
MNTCQFIDGYVACATMANLGDKPAAALIGTFNFDYSVGWVDALQSETLFRCMKREIFDSYAPDCARYSLALRSDKVRGCLKCHGKGWVTVGCHDPEESEQVDCLCLESALDDIAQEIGN